VNYNYKKIKKALLIICQSDYNEKAALIRKIAITIQVLYKHFKSWKIVVQKYKQALRGLFTAGTSKVKSKKGKGRQQTRIEFRASAECPLQPAGHKPQNNERNYWQKKLG